METTQLPVTAHKSCWLTLFLLIMCLAMLSNPYYGIIHDARLYTVEALHKLNSLVYADDFYFLNTYQSKFSITTSVYAALISVFGMSAAYLILLVAGQALWLAGAYSVTGVFFRGFSHFAALAVVVAFPSHYGGRGIFSFFEPFYTPRILSEAFVFFALFFWAKRNWFACLPCIAVAFVMHPLMAVPGVVALALLVFREHKKILWALVPAGLGILVLAGMGAEPFSNIFHVMDGNWLKAVQDRSKHLFITMWSSTDLVLTLVMFSLACMAFSRLKEKTRSLVGAIILTALLLNAISFVFADLLHNILILQLQLWRSLWLLCFIVALSFFDLIACYTQKGPVGLVAASLLCYSLFGLISSSYLYMALLAGISLFALLNLVHFLNLRWKDNTTYWRFVAYFCILASILNISKVLDYDFIAQTLRKEQVFTSLTMIVPSITILIIFVGHLVYRRKTRCSTLLAITAMITLVCATIYDRRTDIQRKFFTDDATVRKIQQVVPDTSLVFWPGSCDLAWFYVQRSNFISREQMAGVVFSKRQAEEYIQKKWLAGLDAVSSFGNGLVNIPLGTGKKLFSSTKVDYICRQYPQLDFIFVPDKFSDLKPVALFSLDLVYAGYLRYFPNEQPITNPQISVYSCNVIRSMISSAQSTSHD